MTTSGTEKETKVERPAGPDEKARSSHFGTLFILYVGFLAVGAILLFRPRPVSPNVSPSLPALADTSKPANLTPDAERALAAEPGREAREAVQQTALAEAESLAGTPPPDVRKIHAQAVASVNALEAAGGPEAVSALRQSMSDEVIEAVTDQGQSHPAELVGGFPSHLARYGVVREGTLRAPTIVLRALSKARWNAMAGRELLDGLSDAETQGYWGWLAFHAEGAEVARRLTALNAYEAAGGTPSKELRAMLLARLGATLDASTVMEEAASATGNLRLRNHALALVQAAAGSGTP